MSFHGSFADLSWRRKKQEQQADEWRKDDRSEKKPPKTDEPLPSGDSG